MVSNCQLVRIYQLNLKGLPDLCHFGTDKDRVSIAFGVVFCLSRVSTPTFELDRSRL